MEQRVYKLIRVEFLQILNALAHADVFDRNAKLRFDRYGDAALGGSIQLRQDNAGDIYDFPELAGLLQGVVDAGETSSESFSTSKFHLYAPYIAEVNFQYPLDCIVMSNDMYEQLNSEQQQILLDCAQEAADAYNEKCYAEFEAYRPTMIEEGAIFLDIDREEWIEDMQGFYTQLEDENFFDDPELIQYALDLKESMN